MKVLDRGELLGSRLKSLRGGLSQSVFAAQLNVKQTTYSAWERGRMEPTASMIVLICSRLNISADWLLGITDTRGGTETNTAWQEKYLGAAQQLSRVNKALGFILKGTNELQSIIEEGGGKNENGSLLARRKTDGHPEERAERI
jgi:transcriptional regulator with XRE-family HTH domain